MLKFFTKEEKKEWERELEKQEKNKSIKLPKKFLIPIALLVVVLVILLGVFVFLSLNGRENSIPSKPHKFSVKADEPIKVFSGQKREQVKKEYTVDKTKREGINKIQLKPKKEALEQNRTPDLSADKFVGVYVKQAIEELKETLKREFESKYKRASSLRKKETILNEETIPSVITVDGVIELPNGGYILRKGNMEIVTGSKLFDGWTVTKIDENYIYLQKRVIHLSFKGGKTEKREIVNVKKVRYIFQY